nr:MAG TPA: hypothetical protein [Caudoviricetes sp.]
MDEGLWVYNSQLFNVYLLSLDKVITLKCGLYYC